MIVKLFIVETTEIGSILYGAPSSQGKDQGWCSIIWTIFGMGCLTVSDEGILCYTGVVKALLFKHWSLEVLW